jgi:hypothetical protein
MFSQIFIHLIKNSHIGKYGMVEKKLKKKVIQWMKSLKLENRKKKKKEVTKWVKPCRIKGCIIYEELLSS